MEYLSDILQYCSRIKSGEFDFELPVLGHGSFSKLAQDINTIADLANDCIKDSIKSDIIDTNFILEISNNFSIDKNNLSDKLEQSKKLAYPLIESFNLTEYIDHILTLYKSNFEIHNLFLKYNYENNNSNVNGDKRLLNLVLFQLLDNIINHSLPNTKVYVDIYSSQDRVALSLKNVSAEEVDLHLARSKTLSSIRFCENLLYIQNIRLDIIQEACLFKCTLLF